MRYIILSGLSSYLAQKFIEYNKKFFDNKLVFRPIKEITNKQMLGEYVPNLCYRFNKILNKNHDFADIVLLHEMCHQAQVEIDKEPLYKLIGTKKDPHTKVWEKYMKMVGLVPPQRYATAEGFNDIDIKNLSPNEIMDIINENKKQNAKDDKIELKRIELNKKEAYNRIIELVKPKLEKLAKAKKIKLADLIKKQKELLNNDWDTYIKRLKNLGIAVPNKILLGHQNNWKLKMFDSVENQLEGA